VLIPLDGSAVGELVLEPVTALWGPEHTEYTLLQVVEPETELDYGPAGGSVTGFQESLDDLREREQAELSRIGAYLETVAARLRARSFTVHTRVVASQRPASAILEDASVHGADVIALATRCRKGLRRLVLGSVADKVLRGANASVFTYRPA
jgi:nucleotide-binding universal stress UspA family protein